LNLVRGRAEARWLPSRHHYAIFRLAAYVRLRLTRGTRAENVAFAIDRDQSATENHGMAAWIALTAACYFSGGPFESWPLPLGLLIGALLTVVLMHVPICTFGLLLPNRNNIRLTSNVTMLVLIAAAAYYATSPSWVRFVAWQFLAVLVLNAVAAMIVVALRGSIARVEAAFVP
jgi:hypothetical protein